MELRHHATRTGAGGRVFCSANKTIQACRAVTPKWTAAFGSIWTPSLETNQADAVRDGNRPASVCRVTSWLESGIVCVPATEAPRGEDRVSARARDERGTITTASWTHRDLQQEAATHGSADS